MNKPYAIFRYHQYNHKKGRIPLYEVKGGPHNGSTMTLKGLKKAGIEIKEGEDESNQL